MSEIKSFGMFALKVAVAVAVIAAIQKHGMAIPVVGAYLPKAA